MSETQTPRKRRASVSQAAFLAAVVAGVKAGSTNAEVAAQLGMVNEDGTYGSFTTRLAQENAAVVAAGGKALKLKRPAGTGGASKSRVENKDLLDLIAELSGEQSI
jgi:hypothetical protein